MKLFKSLGISAVCILIASVFAVPPAIADSTPEELIPDENYRSCVQTKLGNGVVITEQSLATIVTLVCSDRSIENPAGTEYLTSIQELDLRLNRIREVPENILQDLTELSSLDLAYNEIQDLPAGVFRGLSGLEHLYFYGNQFGELPEEVFQGLINLKTLDLGANGLSELPTHVFSGLTSLETLQLYNNELRALPEEVFQDLESLNTLNFFNNEIVGLPEGIFQGLTNLQVIQISNNEFGQLPEGIFRGLVNLEVLVLSDTAIAALPENVFQGLTALWGLVLSDNEIETLPPGVFQSLTGLQVLSVSNNRIKELPTGLFSGQAGLEMLHMYGNSLLDVSEVPNGIPVLDLSDQTRSVVVFPDVATAGLPVINTNGDSLSGTFDGQDNLARWNEGEITWIGAQTLIGQADVIDLPQSLLGGEGSFSVTFTATLAAPIVVMSFLANGGTGVMDPIEVEKDSVLIAPENSFLRQGYSFSGWNTAADGSGKAYGSGEPLDTSGDLTLYAQWLADPVPPILSVTVDFLANGGTGTMPSINAPSGAQITLPQNAFVREGYVFVGWSTNSEGTGGFVADSGTMTLPIVNADGIGLSLYAQWQEQLRPVEPSEKEAAKVTVGNLPSTGAYDLSLVGMAGLLAGVGATVIVVRRWIR